MFSDLLPSNKRPTFARDGSRRNVFNESLPSNGCICHSINSLPGIQLRTFVVCITTQTVLALQRYALRNFVYMNFHNEQHALGLS
jgi:hypothetical protein